MYIPTKAKSIDLRIDDGSRSGVIGSNVTITPNPSYSVGPNLLRSGKESEYQYDYVQTDDGLVKHDRIVEYTTSGGDEVIDTTADNVYIDPNPSYSVAQDVKLEDNPSYDKLQL